MTSATHEHTLNVALGEVLGRPRLSWRTRSEQTGHVLMEGGRPVWMKFKVYPRVGGATGVVLTVVRVQEGLSPCGRGNHHETTVPKSLRRSIPAWAGQPQSLGVLEVSPTAEEIVQRVAAVAPSKQQPPIMVLAIDGAHVPTRPESAKGPKGQVRGGLSMC